jgi:hypothetical protein
MVGRALSTAPRKLVAQLADSVKVRGFSLPFRPGCALALLLWGCSPGLGRAEGALRSGLLPAAAGELREREALFRSRGGADYLRYARLRGLVELGMGNLRAADTWLTLAKRADRADPALYDSVERGELDAAWRSMGRMPGDGATAPIRP